MTQHIRHVTILVRDYDEAIAYYTQVLGFQLLEDTPLSSQKRWVLVAPPGQSGAALLLSVAATEEQSRQIGNQAGGRVFLFLQTDNFWKDYEEMFRRGVQFAEKPRREIYGTVVVFTDLYGNRWDLLEMCK